MARLSTHVLDTARGVPAAGVTVELHFIGEQGRRHIGTVATDLNGRGVLFSGERMEIGTYELTFHAGDYLRGNGVPVSDPPFLDLVVIRFGVAEAAGNYHVPLLLSAYGYSTYRGS